MAVDLAYAITLPPQKAIEYFESKGYAISFRWDDMLNEAHAKAFTVAGAMKLDLLAAIRGELDTALKEGNTLQAFRKEMTPVLKKHGFWGEVEVTDPQTGEVRTTNVTPWRLRTIYRTNMQSAYMAGRYQAQTEDDNRPYLQYVALMDANTRDAHAGLNGTVLHKDDPFWDTNYPPNGWGCRCRVRARSERDVERQGLKVLARGKATSVADKGFKSNPGKAAWQPELEKYNYDESRSYVESALAGPAFERFLQGKTENEIPVAVLDEKYAKLLASKVHTVRLSAQSLEKNKKHHPDINSADYKRIPKIISTPQKIFQKGDNKLLFIRKYGDIWFAVVKSTKAGDRNYLVSFRRSNEKDIERERSKSDGVILDEPFN